MQKGDATVYLFGSLHILPMSIEWTTPEIKTAMESSGVFFFEAPADRDAQLLARDFILYNGVLPRGATLRQVLTHREYLIYSTILIRAGLKPELFERYRPWLASLVLGLAYLYPDKLAGLVGADDALIDYAQMNGKEVHYLESVEQQMSLLTRPNEASQIRELKRLIQSLPQTRVQSELLLDLWRTGDVDRLGMTISSYFRGYPGMEDALVGNRNRIWLSQIESLLGSGETTAMVTVGAAHMAGNKGLLALLCAEGYDVERVSAPGGTGSKVCAARTG